MVNRKQGGQTEHLRWLRGVKRSKRQAFACFFGLLFVMPYLQHNLYHTTLFAGLGADGFAIFAFFAALLAVGLIGCIVGQGPVGTWLRSRRRVAVASVLGTAGTLLVYLAPSLGVDARVWVAVGAGLYALGFGALAVRAILVLGAWGRQAGLRAAIAVVSLAALTALIVFAYSIPAPLYAFVAVAGLGLSGVAQACYGPLGKDDGAELAVSEGDGADIYGRGWRFFYLIFCAIVLLHGLLYVADPALEFLGDTAVSRGVAFVLLLGLSMVLLMPAARAPHYLRLVCLFGNVVFAVLFLGLVALGFLSVTQGDFSLAASVVLALIRVFDVLLLIALLVSALLKGTSLVRAGALYLLAFYWLPVTFAYVLLPMATDGRGLDMSAALGPAALVLAVVLVLAILVFLTVLVARSGRTEAVDVPRAEGEGRRSACEVLAQRFDLTRRETEVLYYVSLGYSSKAAGEKLFVAAGTVQSHTKRIYAKLGVHSKQELIELVDCTER